MKSKKRKIAIIQLENGKSLKVGFSFMQSDTRRELYPNLIKVEQMGNITFYKEISYEQRIINSLRRIRKTN